MKNTEKWAGLLTRFILFGAIGINGLLSTYGGDDDHQESDQYWAELAKLLPAYEVQPQQLRVAAPNERYLMGNWSSKISWPHVAVSAANLPDGRILTFASNERTSFPGGRPEFTYASIWDPATNQFKDVNHGSHDLFCGHLVMLENGRVFVNGGRNTVPLTSEFDSRTDSWLKLQNMTVGRWYPTTTYLPNGEVFTASGNGGPNNAERWSRSQGWTRLTGIQWGTIAGAAGFESNWWPYNFLAPNGRIFHAGPTDAMHWVDPTGAGSLQPAGITVPGSKYPKHASVAMFTEGQLIVAGGAANTGGGSTAETYIVDMNSDAASVNSARSMAFPRRFSNPVMLPTGEFLVIGGNTSGTKFSDSGTVLTPELWNPDTGEWRQMSDMTVPRNYHSIALLLADGRVLAAGGGLCGCSADHPDAEIFTPHYLYNPDGSLATRPVLTSAPQNIGHGSPFEVRGTPGLKSFSLVKMMATTHALSTDIRYLPVNFAESSPGVYQLTPHINRNVLTPGYWMLHGLDAKSVPSVASVVLVTGANNASPEITSPGNQVYRLGQVIDLAILARDPEGTRLNFSATGLPDGLRIDPLGGHITGTVISAGIFESTISVTDTDGGTSNLRISWVISSGIICDVVTNIAPSGSAVQSSEYAVAPFPASNAIDGNISNFSHTADGQTPSWWRLDFASEKSMQLVKIYNRTDCCGQRFSDLTVEVLGSSGNVVWQSPVLNPNNELNSPSVLSVDLVAATGGALSGKAIRISRTQSKVISGLNDATLLSLAEVEVFGCEQITGNRAPIFANPGTQTNRSNENIRLALNVSDPDGDSISFSATGLPQGLTINPSTGQISGILQQSGSYSVTVTADDGRNGVTSITFLWIISTPGGTVYNFADFTDSSAWQLNGNATSGSGVLTLTQNINNQVGSAFIKTPIDLTSNPDFLSHFRFRIHGTADGADGMAFILQGVGPTALGTGGGGLGLQGLTQSLAVELDTFQNGTTDKSSNEIALIQNGNVTAPLAAVALPATTIDLEDGAIHNMWVEYIASSRTVQVFLAKGDPAQKPADPIIRVGDIDLISLTGPTAYIGFSAATGGANNFHNIHSFSFQQGVSSLESDRLIRREWWTGINGSLVQNLTADARYPASPSGSELLNLFEGPVNWADNYGSRLSGVVYPPVSGDYVFYVSGDDNTQLWISSDQSPQNKRLIAQVPGWTGPREWTKFPEQKSAPVSLVAGKPYFIEALHKEGGGLDNVAVAWEAPLQSLAVIEGRYFIAPDVNFGRAGLFGQYFEGLAFNNPKFTRGDEVINFNWGTGSPDPSRLAADKFSARWTGFLVPEFSETYTFYTTSDDGVRLWIGDQLVINNWTDHAPIENAGTINLTANKPVPIKLEYYENGGGAVISLAWSSVSLGKQIIGPAFLKQGVDNPEFPPVVESPGNQISPLGASIQLSILATDPEGEPVRYAAINLPTGLTIDPVSGLISGNVTTVGSYNVTVTVTDTAQLSQAINFGWIVTDELFIENIVPSPAPINTPVSYTVPVRGGINPTFQWNFGDGSPSTDPSNSPIGSHVYTKPGYYIVSLIARDATGREIRQSWVQGIHLPLTSNRGATSMSLIFRKSPNGGSDEVWNVNPDNDIVTVSELETLKKSFIPVGISPRALTMDNSGRIWVSNKKSSTISVIDASTRAVMQTINLPLGSLPHGIVFSGSSEFIYVVLEGRGEILKLRASDGGIEASQSIGAHPRHITISGDGNTIWVSRFITPPLPGESSGVPMMESNGNPAGGEVLKINAQTLLTEKTVVLRSSNKTDAENAARGVPNYLGGVALSPDGTSAWIPSKQDNIFRGSLRDGNPLGHDNTVRSISSRLDLTQDVEDYAARIDHDNAGMPSAAIFGPRGLYLFVALEASQSVAIVRAYENIEIARFTVGAAPQGLAISEDGNQLFVHNFLSRSVSVHDISRLIQTNSMNVPVNLSLGVVANEKLPQQVLQGKRLFYDARDTRLAREQYISCATCHNDGGEDGRVWDISSLGEGLRNTISLIGRAGMAHGALHWSGNFDEIQDFEEQIRNLAGGTGLIPDAKFNVGTVSKPLGDPKAGLSVDLDALAAYVTSLDDFGASPFRNPDGTNTASAIAGEQVFVQANCIQCHSGLPYSDSAIGTLHNIGTLSAVSGKRLGADLTGIDTPTLRGLWNSAPYLHDGSASNLNQAIQRHSGVNLTEESINDLVAYLLELDQSSPRAPGNQPPVIQTVAAQASDQGQTITLSIVASDPELSTLTFSAVGLPEGIAMDPLTGLISGAATKAGNFPVVVTVSDVDGASQSVSFSWVVNAVIPPINPAKIVLDGNLADWPADGWIIQDPLDVSGTGVQVDLTELRILHDESSVCLAYVNQSPITLNWGYVFYMDTDLNSSTGYSFWGLGADYMVSGKDLYRYRGDGTSWSWELLFTLPVGQSGNSIEMGFPSSLIGSPEAMNVILLGDNTAFGSSGFDFVPDLKNGALQRIVYRFKPEASGPGGIIMDGLFEDWNDIGIFAADPRDVTKGEIDWKSLWITRDDLTLYISFDSWQNYPTGWAENLYIDTDANAGSGFRVNDIGAEFLLQSGIFYQYTGNGSSWSWQPLASGSSARNNLRVEASIPLATIGNPAIIRIQLVAANEAYAAENDRDYLPDDGRGLVFRLDGQTGNALPVVRNATYTTRNDVPRLIKLMGTDAENDELSFTILSTTSHGTLTQQSQYVLYQPASGFTGLDTFTFTASDSGGASTPGTIEINVLEPLIGNNFAVRLNNATMDGSLGEWANVPPVIHDQADIESSGSEIDWRNLWLGHDAEFAYIAFRNDSPILVNWGIAFYLDVDKSPDTGFSIQGGGADFLIQGEFIFRYTGTGIDWSWEFVSAAVASTLDHDMELRVDRSLFPALTGGYSILCLGDNAAYNLPGIVDSLDVDSGWLNYTFNDSIIAAQETLTAISPIDSRKDQNYSLRILTDKPEATNDDIVSANIFRTIHFELSVKPGYRLILERSEDLKRWTIVYQRVIKEQGFILVDPEINTLPDVGYFRAILIEEPLSDLENPSL
ncbi:MAG: putative Ig domain-containing protein [Verrucomicrobia bacterium]|nr:putative Ig domain-containing protein [Verrucomicrobiota bacterium]